MALGHNEMAYAVHTATCTYLLDEDGICRWIVSQQGVVPGHVRQCIGAQFVACLDLSVEGGLVGELRTGTRGLFVGMAEDRMVLLRTGLIRHVDDRRAQQESQRQLGTQQVRATQQGRPAPQLPAAAVHANVDQYGKRQGMPYRAKPPRFGVVRRSGEEQTITVNRHADRASERYADADTLRRVDRNPSPDE